MSAPRIARVSARPLNAPLKNPFEISTGSQSSMRNVLVTAVLSDGTSGHGECAPFPAFNGETQADVLKAVRRAASRLEGRPPPAEAETAKTASAAARAGIEMALLDAWTRHHRVPLYVYFGGAGNRVATDVTISIVDPRAAALSAAAIARRGIRALKVKVGKDPESDAERVAAAMSRMPKASLIVDGNGGYDSRSAGDFLRRLRKRGIRPDLFEQPVPKDDWDGLRAVSRSIPVAADESAASPGDVLRLARSKTVQYVNIKLMKCGVHQALEMARVARAAGLGLMIGGMIESRLAMACSAHLAAGFGGFRFIDLDTPLYLASDPMRGPVGIGPGGVWDVGRARAGIGVGPK